MHDLFPWDHRRYYLQNENAFVGENVYREPPLQFGVQFYLPRVICELCSNRPNLTVCLVLKK